jgi:hypothetical protein
MTLLLALLAQDLSAADTFRMIEDAALKAPSFRVSSKFQSEKDGKPRLGFTGTALFKEGKQAWDLRFDHVGPETKIYRVVSDGARLLWEEPGWSKAGELPKGFDRLHRLVVVRVGLYQAFMFAYTPYHPGPRDNDPADEASWKVEDFTHGPDEGAAKSLLYSIRIRGSKEPWRVKLIYDPGSWAVRGHSLGKDDEALKQAGLISMDWKAGVEIPDGLFTIPPGK